MREIGSSVARQTGREFETTEFRLLLMSVLAGAIGLVAGFIAFGLYKLIGFFTNLFFYGRLSTALVSPAHTHLGFWIVGITTLGGLVIGIMARYGSSAIRGHGIPEAMEAILINNSRISPRVGVLKPISAALAIGTGGPFGAEGPIIQTGGAFGSFIGQLLHTTAAERKVLLACGAAAGMAATFSAPIASVILAIQLLLFEFRSRSFIPLVIASALAAGVHLQLLGRGAMFSVGNVNFGMPYQLPVFAVLGLICGVAASLFTRVLYWMEDTFERLPLDPLWWPAIAGIGLGVLGVIEPRVLGVGYDTISDILHNNLAFQTLLAVMALKLAALVLTIGSGTSGGLLAPMFMAGAALGGVFAMAANAVFPGLGLAPSAYAVAGMAALFGSASRAGFALIVFAFEITRDYDSILPLMVTVVIAEGIAIATSRNSVMTEKLARRGIRVPQDFESDVFAQVSVQQVMESEVQTVPATMTAGDLAERVTRRDPSLAHYHAFPVVSESGALVGMVTRSDIMRALERGQEELTVEQAGTTDVIVAYPDEPLHDAVARMLWADVGRLPVVKRERPDQLVGYLDRACALGARLERLRREHVRETGWLRALKGAAGRRTL